MKELLPESHFQLYAVCVREPQALFQQVPPTKLQDGVYELVSIDRRVRIIVVQQLPLAEQNAFLHLFSTRLEQVRYAREHYKPRTQDLTTLFYQLIKVYYEDPKMSKVLKDYARETIRELLKVVPAEERVEGISPEKRLEGLSVEEIIKVFTPEQLEAMEALIRQRKNNGPPQKTE